MSHTCLPNEIRLDQRYRSLKPSQRCLLLDIVGDLQSIGDGRLSDDQLRGGRSIGAANFRLLTDRIAEWGWLARDPETDKLIRAGCLAESPEAEFQLISPAAEEKREYRLAKKVAAMVLKELRQSQYPSQSTNEPYPGAAPQTTGQNPAENRTAEAKTPDISPPKTGQPAAQIALTPAELSAPASLSHTRAFEVESSRVESTDDISSSNRFEFDATDRAALAIVAEPQRWDIERRLKAIGLNDKQCDRAFAPGGRTLQELLDGADCFEQGGWKGAKNRVALLASYCAGGGYLDKEWLAGRTVRSRASPIGQTAAVMSVDGGSSNGRASNGHQVKRQSREEREAERLRDEEEARSAMRAMVDGLRGNSALADTG